MAIDAQSVVNILGGVICALLGYFLNDLHAKFKENRAEIGQHAKDLTALKVIVAGDYIKRDDFEKIMSESFDLIRQVQSDIVQSNREVVSEINKIKVTCAAVHGKMKGGE